MLVIFNMDCSFLAPVVDLYMKFRKGRKPKNGFMFYIQTALFLGRKFFSSMNVNWLFPGFQEFYREYFFSAD
jgi:hypothetical protein